MTAPTKAIVLFAHGSRDPLWHKPMEAVAARIVAMAPDTPVACAYLELSKPDLPTAVATLLALGVHTISVLPLFLGVGKHAREDLPRLIAD
jgi:sirohydrochlorin cobaltochelatase